MKGWFRCDFHSSKTADKADPEMKKVGVNRCEVIDSTVLKIREQRLHLPRNAESIPDLFNHLTALTRIYNEERLEYEWIGDKPDHYLFAMVYATVARRIMVSI
jgi:hypothetical protein